MPILESNHGSPPTRIEPAAGSLNPAMALNVDVLPLPDAPNNASVRPLAHSSCTRSATGFRWSMSIDRPDSVAPASDTPTSDSTRERVGNSQCHERDSQQSRGHDPGGGLVESLDAVVDGDGHGP